MRQGWRRHTRVAVPIATIMTIGGQARLIEGLKETQW